MASIVACSCRFYPQGDQVICGSHVSHYLSREKWLADNIELIESLKKLVIENNAERGALERERDKLAAWATELRSVLLVYENRSDPTWDGDEYGRVVARTLEKAPSAFLFEGRK
ncbi:MAG: hypothetical protein QME66_08210 [Candidatus Eisenbacteria bacterium]|nr:hypothetical protein [Candidatus Eisenbacteria bacterium]